MMSQEVVVTRGPGQVYSSTRNVTSDSTMQLDTLQALVYYH